ncbi:MAG: hypothetical protein U5Q44_08535 [Dehalococcoidia bacterium]|nr:hypothetical protein [Dehalococcoidia bacterium]
MTSPLPDFDDLPQVPGLDLRHAWDVFGRDDALGSINLVTPERVARAAASVSTGKMYPLDLPLNLPSPPLFGRQPVRAPCRGAEPQRDGRPHRRVPSRRGRRSGMH